ncbi:MAG: phytoene desaturase family protein [Myxococcaceae bacterium]
MIPKKRKVLIVGAGVGGLSAAARLAHQGFDVEVIEKAGGPGGRCGHLQIDGFHFDTGPTLLLMPEVLEATFAAVDRKMSDYLELVRCDPNYKMHFRDGSEMTFSTELAEMGRELDRIEPGSFGPFLKFLALGEDQYRTSLDHFVGRNFDSPLQMFTPRNLGHVFRIKAHRTLYGAVSRSFKDERLRAALTFQTMYLGISPFRSPAVYGLLPYTELAVGIWFPMGGMAAIPRALEKLGRDLGVTFRYRTSVEQILVKGGQATGVRLSDQTVVPADIVLCNADLPWAYKHLVDAKDSELKRADRLRYTCSAYMMYLGVKKRDPQLHHHNVFFGGDYEGSFKDIFEKRRVPEDPSFYVNAPAHTDPSLAPLGKDSLYVLVPVPDMSAEIDWAKEGPLLRQKVFSRLAAEGWPDLASQIEVERTFTPKDWEFQLNLERGSAFGLSHNFFQVGPFRPKNQDANVGNLFFVGASTQPGTGLPMVMLSAKLVTERIVASA